MQLENSKLLLSINSWEKDHRHLVFLSLLLIGFLIRFLSFYHEMFMLNRDSIFYLSMCERIAQNGYGELSTVNLKEVANIPPGFFILTTFCFHLGLSSNVYYPIILVTSYVVLAASVFYGIYLISNNLRYSEFGLLIIITNPWLVRISYNFTRDPIYLCVCSLGIFLVLYIISKNKPLLWILFPPLCICSTLIRKEGMELFCYFVLWNIILIFVYLAKRSIKKALYSFLLLSSVSALTIFPLIKINQYFISNYASKWIFLPKNDILYTYYNFQEMFR